MTICCGSNGNPFTQTRFMGASVVGFSAQADWNGQGGGLQVELVNDTCDQNAKVYVDSSGNILTTTDADNFDPPPVGSPAFFYFGGFTHCGILHDWQCQDSAEGHKHYRVNVVSPKDIVDGVQLVLRHYDGGTYGCPNLVNVNGYLQSLCGACGETGFSVVYPPMGMSAPMTYTPAPGFCKVSEAGWRLYLIRTAILGVINSNITAFGGYIQFRNHSYMVDLSELPVLDSEIRFAEENMSLGEFVSKVCELAGVDHFWEVTATVGAGDACPKDGHLATGPHILKVRCGTRPWQAYEQSAEDIDLAICSNIDDRLNQGVISQAITTAACVNRYSTGLELRLDKTTAFMTGEFRKDVWQMAYSGTGDGYSDTIWPFWGFDYAGNVIVGEGYAYNNFELDTPLEKKTHTFTIPITHLGLGINTWTVSVPELRCVLYSEDSWRAWLLNMEPDKYTALYNPGADLDFKQLEANFFTTMMAAAVANPNANGPRPKGLDFFNWGEVHAGDGLDDKEERFRRCGLLYQHLRKLAAEYYGRRFMVKLPFLCASYNPDSPYSIATNWNPCDAGWTELPVLGLPQTSPILEFFRVEDARVKCFARFISSAIEIYDDDGNKKPVIPPIRMEKMNKDNFWPVSAYEVYVSGTVERIVWVSPTDPRAVIDMGAAVEIDNPNEFLPEWLLFNILLQNSNADIEKWNALKINKMTRMPGGDKLAIGAANMLLLPVSATVPLQSDKLVYGPWFAKKSGLQFDFRAGGVFWEGYVNGQTTYERDSSYAPWNFGTSSIMNNIAYVHVASMLGDKYVMERGDITMPGAPTAKLGDLIAAGGPMISQIDVSVERGSGAIMTTLRMKTYTPDYGKLWKARIDYVRRANGIGYKASRMFAKYSLNVYKDVIDRKIEAYVAFMERRRHKAGSSHDLMSGWVNEDPENSEHGRGSVVNGDFYNQITTLYLSDDDEYQSRALMETYGMFRPFSTHTDPIDAPLMSRFKTFTASGPIPISDGWPTGNGEYLTNNIDFYSKEQVPPIFCQEHHLPICVETLSPFLSNGTSSTTNLWMNENGYNSKGHDIEYIARDGTYPTHLSVRHPSDNYSDSHWYRAIALRGPLVIAGWGFDTNNKPVPNASPIYPDSPKMQFKEDWLRRPQDWKCGPVDLRWDEDRKVWTAPVPHKIVRCILGETIAKDGCAPAIIIDDQIQHDVNGNEIEKETICGEEGYKITLYNKHMRPIPKGWKVTAYYDTEKSKYYVLSHDEFPILEATLDEDLLCDDDAEATIIGVAGGGSLDICGAFTGYKIKLTNPLKQPICQGKKVFAYINDVILAGSNPGGPILTECETSCDKIDKFKGVVLQGEFEPECVVTKLEMLEFKIWNLDIRSGVGEFSFEPHGTIEVETDAKICNGIANITIPGFTVDIPGATGNINGNVAVTGNLTIPELDFTIPTFNVATTATGVNFTAYGRLSGEYPLTIDSHTGTLVSNGSVSVDFGTHVHNINLSDSFLVEGDVTSTGTVPGQNASVTVNVTSVGTTSTGSVTVNGTAAGTTVTVTSNGNITGTTNAVGAGNFTGTINGTTNEVNAGSITGVTDAVDISGGLSGDFPVDFSTPGSGTGEYYDCCCEGIVTIDASITGSHDHILTGSVSETHSHTVTGTCAGTLTDTHSHTVTGTTTVTGSCVVPDLTVTASGTVPSLGVNTTGSGTGTATVVSQNISVVGHFSEYVDVEFTEQTAPTGLAGVFPFTATGTLNLAHNGHVDINELITSTGLLNIPALEVVIPQIDGHTESEVVPVTGLSGVVVGDISFSGVTAIIPPYTGTVTDLTGDVVAESTATFTPQACNVQYTVKYRNYWEFYRYELCICTKQIYLETGRGIPTCTTGKTPPCNCDCEDFECSCAGGDCPTPVLSGGIGSGWYNGLEDIFTADADCGEASAVPSPSAVCP